MLSKIYSAAVTGFSCELVCVETDITTGFPSFTIVGLPDAAVREAKERIRSAIKNAGFEFPYNHRIVINLAPSTVKKIGSGFDLPMALGILLSTQAFELPPERSIFFGELALDGSVRFTKSVLPVTIFARERTMDRIYIPKANVEEACLIKGIEVIAFEHVSEIVRHFKGDKHIAAVSESREIILPRARALLDDFSHIKGQAAAKRGLEVAAAGGHNVLMSGVPGAGKTMLARAFPTVLPPMTEQEILEVTKIYSVAGLLPEDRPIILQRPFRAPHHSASTTALIGGGSTPRPGEVSLAHRGVLFLDELPEFPRAAIESLRQPLEDGTVTVSRVQETVTYPARFMLIASKNPCPCGFLYDSKKQCICLAQQIVRYEQRISGPILDRIDLHLEIARVEVEHLVRENAAESSMAVQERVSAARALQAQRFEDSGIFTNAEMDAHKIKKWCALDEEGACLLRVAVEKMHLSARAYYRVLKVARTIADLAAEARINTQHVAEALQYRPRNE